MKIYTILLFLTASILHSQTMVWEQEIELNYSQYFSLQPSLINSEGNIICLTSPDYKPLDKTNFFKFNTDGDLLNEFKIESAKMEYPVSFYEIDSGYRIFGGYNDNNDESRMSLPYIRNKSKTGEDLSLSFPYWTLPKEQISKYGLIINKYSYRINTNSTITDNNNFYNLSFVEYETIHDTTRAVGIFRVTCYDTNATVLWRQDLDSIGSEMNFVADFKITKSGKFIVSLMNGRTETEQEFKFIEFDNKGNILNKIVNRIDRIENYLSKIVTTEYGYSNLLVQKSLSNNKETAYTLIKFDNFGNILDKVEIPNRHLGMVIDGFDESPNHDIIFWGVTTIVDTDTVSFEDDIYKSFILKYDANLYFKSLLEFDEFGIWKTSKIKHIHFINDEDFIAIGEKERTKFYIAKFSLANSINDKNSNDRNFSISPNPASDFITITIPENSNHTLQGVVENEQKNGQEKVQIFNTLGIEVGQSSLIDDKNRIDISHLPAGVYFVRILGSNGACSIVEKFVKM